MEGEQISIRVIEDEMRDAYMAYAMSVIVGRAIPKIEDGLKPVHRRVLYAMHDMGIRANSSHKKSARVVGEVLGKYHPHGDSAVYDSMVRMAQDFAMRVPLIDGQGNWGSIDGDSAAAMRYTECKLAKVSEELLRDIEKDSVDWIDNFDASLKEPEILPATLPNLLINGTTGIAVGMATNMPPHNLRETCTAIQHYIDDPEIPLAELMNHMPGPDFPTGGVICGRSGILSAYQTGKGKILVRGVLEREETEKRSRLIITEIPYQVVKSQLIQQIADLVGEKRIEGIADLRDESDRLGMRVVIELKRDAHPDIVENQLFKHTRLQQTFGIINLAIVEKRPQVLSLQKMFAEYLKHRLSVIQRRTQYDLDKAEQRSHILEGLLIALENLDTVIPLIRKSSDGDVAKTQLMSNYDLSETQAKAILDMRLQRLTGLEREKIETEHKELQLTISDLKNILATPIRQKSIIKNELEDIKNSYGDDRRTNITDAEEDIDLEDLIEPEDMVVTISNSGYVKRISTDTYRAQKRGGVGIIGATAKEGDYIDTLLVANTHNYLLFFTDSGRVHWKKVYQIPESGRTARGTPIVNVVELKNEEQVSAVISVDEFDVDKYIFFATKNGTVKKTSLADYSRPRMGGIHAIKLDEGDELVRVILTNGSDNILLTTAQGQAIHFPESDVRPMGRVSRGVRGIKLRSEDEVISAMLASEGGDLLTITKYGYGKRTPVDQYPIQKRGGYGVRNLNIKERNGVAMAARMVSSDDELLLITQNGIIIRTTVHEISQIGRNTQGVRVMRMRNDDTLAAIAKVIHE